jgi:ankyrin repeat protein
MSVVDKGGHTALTYAAANTKNPAIVRFLLGAGADACVETNDGHRAADYAELNPALTGTEEFHDLLRACK